MVWQRTLTVGAFFLAFMWGPSALGREDDVNHAENIPKKIQLANGVWGYELPPSGKAPAETSADRIARNKALRRPDNRSSFKERLKAVEYWIAEIKVLQRRIAEGEAENGWLTDQRLDSFYDLLSVAVQKLMGERGFSWNDRHVRHTIKRAIEVDFSLDTAENVLRKIPQAQMSPGITEAVCAALEGFANRSSYSYISLTMASRVLERINASLLYSTAVPLAADARTQLWKPIFRLLDHKDDWVAASADRVVTRTFGEAE